MVEIDNPLSEVAKLLVVDQVLRMIPCDQHIPLEQVKCEASTTYLKRIGEGYNPIDQSRVNDGKRKMMQR